MNNQSPEDSSTVNLTCLYLLSWESSSCPLGFFLDNITNTILYR
jgi:hypothetical protein